ncbi:uncharacterized protein [Temnothorax longispinosus]|uniref:uncharacterized protein n=1 Tax=Temnothorax longispinosus TaxID=300112 RepID=UPI003A99A9D1
MGHRLRECRRPGTPWKLCYWKEHTTTQEDPRRHMERTGTPPGCAYPIPLNIILAYAPTSTAEDKVVERFYNQLETSIKKIPKKKLLIVLGDFNAKIGDTSMDMNLPNTIENYGLGTRNDRGNRLLQFATENDKDSFIEVLQKETPRWLNETQDENPDYIWQSAKKFIKDSVSKSQPKITATKHKHWMSDSTWELQLKPKNWAIENSEGNCVTEIKKIVEVWRKYCVTLFADTYDASDHISITADSEREPGILRDEIRAAIKHLKEDKAVGTDKIPIEVIRDMGEFGVDILHIICSQIWDTGEWPKNWCHSLFIPLHKKGSTTKCNNYRTIALISYASKVLLHILNTRLQAYLNREIAPEQAGFVKGRGTREQMHILRQIIEKAREFNNQLYICFVDFRKAFDTVKWNKLREVLTKMSVPYHLVHIIKKLYVGSTAAVWVDGIDSGDFEVRAGVRQGCILSLLLFNIYTEYIMRIALEEWDKGVSVGGRLISNLRCADDTTLLASTEEDILNLFQLLERISLNFGLAINRDKTKMKIVDRMADNRPDVRSIANCEVVHSYTYLGSMITNKGECEEEIKRLCAMTRFNRILTGLEGTPATQRSICTNDHLKLPRVDLPTFSGTFEEWIPFRNMFQSMINQNATLLNIQKMQYLLAALKGEARDVIGSLEVLDENYIKAWEMLKKRYDDSGYIVQKHIKALFEIPCLETLASVKGIEKAHRALGRLNSRFSNESLGSDPNTSRAWEISVKRGEVPTLKQLTDFLAQHSKALEASSRTAIPVNRINVNELQVSEGIVLADPEFYKSSKVDLLLGAEIFFDLMYISKIKNSKTQPTWQKTILG